MFENVYRARADGHHAEPDEDEGREAAVLDGRAEMPDNQIGVTKRT